jgi:hypothetical protein
MRLVMRRKRILPHTKLGWIVGAAVGKGPFTVRLNYLRAPVDTVIDGTLAGGGTGKARSGCRA